MRKTDRIDEPALIIRMPNGEEVELGISLEIPETLEALKFLTDWRRRLVAANGGNGNMTVFLRDAKIIGLKLLRSTCWGKIIDKTEL